MNYQIAKALWEYNKDTGIFTWKIKPCIQKEIGDIAGYVDKQGYVILTSSVCSKNKAYKAHRIAYLLMTGFLPKEKIDHINGITGDNRWINLREASNSENSYNRKKSSKNTSGYKGVHKKGKKWIAQIQINKSKIYLGIFDSKEEAHKIYCEKSKELFGSFYRDENLVGDNWSDMKEIK